MNKTELLIGTKFNLSGKSGSDEPIILSFDDKEILLEKEDIKFAIKYLNRWLHNKTFGRKMRNK